MLDSASRSDSPIFAAPPGSCPASAVAMAVKMSRAPLALASGAAPCATIALANEAFAEKFGCEAASLVGRRVDSLGSRAAHAGNDCSELMRNLRPDGTFLDVALSMAEVRGPDGRTVCALCSLMESQGAGDAEAIASKASLLEDIARAAGSLFRESTAAASQLGQTAQEAERIAQEAFAMAAFDGEGSP